MKQSQVTKDAIKKLEIMKAQEEQEGKDLVKGVGVLALCIGLFVGIAWLGAVDKAHKVAEDAKPKKMAPCSSVLDACYKDPTPGVGDAAWYIKQEDRFIKSGLSRD